MRKAFEIFNKCCDAPILYNNYLTKLNIPYVYLYAVWHACVHRTEIKMPHKAEK